MLAPLQRALLYTTLTSQSQHEDHEAELESISKEKEVHSQSPLNKLDHFIDQEGLLRVGGRLALTV